LIDFVRLQNAEMQVQESKAAIQTLRTEFEATSSREAVAISKNEQASERIITLENDLAQLSRASAASEET
jgi:hypothetical protein